MASSFVDTIPVGIGQSCPQDSRQVRRSRTASAPGDVRSKSIGRWPSKPIAESKDQNLWMVSGGVA